MAEPCVSVVMPVYNAAGCLDRAIDSIVAQTLPAQEIVIVDDVSTDGSYDLALARARTSRIPIRVERMPRNSGGPARPINRGLDIARGEYAAILDQDDTYFPEHLATLSRLLEQQPPASFAFCRCAMAGTIDPGVAQVQAPELIRLLRLHSKRWDDYLLLPKELALIALVLHGNFVIGYPGFLFRRSTWQRMGKLDESLRVGSDLDFLCRLSLQGPAVWTDRCLYQKQFHGENLSGTSAASFENGIRVLLRYLPSLLTVDWGIPTSRVAVLLAGRRLVRTCLRRGRRRSRECRG